MTTSWDDGGVFDAKLAGILRRRGVAGTFYWTVGSDLFPMPSREERNEILGLNMEVGSHTMTHPDLTAIDREALSWEVTESKERLEELTGSEISSFCYPFGRFDRRSVDAVRAAGYRLGRTTMGFRKDSGKDPYHMPVSIQLHPHGRKVHVLHALKEGNRVGLGRWVSLFRAETDLVELAERAVEEIRATGGILHIWGHAWELEQFNLWGVLDEVLKAVGGHDDVSYVTNGALMASR